jgi:3-hydroxybutyryl-CoA dehydrogenase
MVQNLLFKRIGVVGSGSRGCGIHQIAASNCYLVRAADAEIETAKSALNRVDSARQKLTRKNLVRERERAAELFRIERGTDLGLLNECDSIIEAAHQGREAKQRGLAQRAARFPRETVFVGNTSGLSISSLVLSFSWPERPFGPSFCQSCPNDEIRGSGWDNRLTPKNHWAGKIFEVLGGGPVFHLFQRSLA